MDDDSICNTRSVDPPVPLYQMHCFIASGVLWLVGVDKADDKASHQQRFHTGSLPLARKLIFATTQFWEVVFDSPSPEVVRQVSRRYTQNRWIPGTPKFIAALQKPGPFIDKRN